MIQLNNNSLQNIISFYLKGYNGIPIDEILEEICVNTTSCATLLNATKQLLRVEECYLLMLLN